MLRFTPPEYLMLEQTEQLRMNFVGTGVNLLANLAHFQLETALITKLPPIVLVKPASGAKEVRNFRSMGRRKGRSYW